MNCSFHVVLVRPKFSRNVGFCSRAMANMGAKNLYLIAPECQVDLEARQGAAGAQQRLMEAQTFKNLDEFLKSVPNGLRIAFSGKPGEKKDSLSYSQRLSYLLKNQPDALAGQVYLFFGPEDDGLKIEDLDSMHFVHALDTYGEFSSLNLAHAVLLACYEFSRATKGQLAFDNRVAETTPYVNIDKSLLHWLETLGFKINDRKRSAYSVLKRIILQNIPTNEELRVLSSVIEQNIRKLKEK